MGKYRYCLVSPHSYNSAHNKNKFYKNIFFRLDDKWVFLSLQSCLKLKYKRWSKSTEITNLSFFKLINGNNRETIKWITKFNLDMYIVIKNIPLPFPNDLLKMNLSY